MGLKSILVHLDQTSRSMTRFELALDLAARQQAVLNAYYATAKPYLVERSADEARQTLDTCAARAAEVDVDFKVATEAEELAPQPLEARLNYQAFFADLCIIGQPDKDAGASAAIPRDLPEKLILTSGRPVLTIPFAGNFSRIGSRVMLAWRSGRASARAVLDALPFLPGAEAVHLISFASGNGDYAQSGAGLKRLTEFLAQHGIKASSEIRQIKDIGLGDALLNRAAEEGIDLLVAGGALPGAPAPLAGQLLKQMTVPVLMSS